MTPSPIFFYLRCSLKMFKPARTATMSIELLMRDIFKMISCILNHELTTCFRPEKEGAQCPSLVEEGPCLEAGFHGSSGPNKSDHWKPSAKGSYSSATAGAWPKTHMISYMLFVFFWVFAMTFQLCISESFLTGAEGVKVQCQLSS